MLLHEYCMAAAASGLSWLSRALSVNVIHYRSAVVSTVETEGPGEGEGRQSLLREPP